MAEENTPQHPTAEAEPAAEQPDGADDLDGVRSELDEHRGRVKELEDQLLRRAAEFQNYRRRTQEDLGGAAARGRAEVIVRMLDVLDDLQRSREAAEQAATEQEGEHPLYDALKQGVDLVAKKFEDALAAFGVEPIPAEGEPFSEALHEAMMQQGGTGQPAGTVVGEVQRGYRMGDRVLRHARVVVAQ